MNSKALFLILSLVFLVQCGKKSSDVPNPPGVSSDSIISWAKKAREKELTPGERMVLLNKVELAIANSPSDTLKTKQLSELSLTYSGIKDSSKFRSANKRATALSIQIGDTVILATSYWDLAFFYSRNSVVDSAYYFYSKAQQLYEAIDDDYHSARMLYNMAVQQARVNDYTGSEITTIKAIELLKPLNRSRELYNCYNNLGSITNNLKEYDRATEYYNKALSYLGAEGTTSSKYLGTLNNLGVSYQDKGSHNKAIDYFAQVLSVDSLILTKPDLYARALDNLAYNRFKLRDTSGVAHQLQRSFEIRDSIKDIRGLSVSAHHMAEYKSYEKDTAVALNYAMLAKEYSKQSSNNGRLLETLQLITKIDPKNASQYTQNYIELSDSLQAAERKIRNKFERIRFETDEFIAENELLARQRQLWIGIAVGLFMLASAVFVIISQRVKNQRLKFEQEQQQANQEIFNLMLTQNQKLEEGKQSEQKRISEELHDAILGQMNGIRMVLLGLNKKADDNAVQMRSEAINKLQEVQEEIRTISHELSDAAYQKFHNFIHSIEDLLKSITAPAQMEYTFEYNGEVDWDGLSGDIKINLYRIVQEGLQNCVKHAKASKVSLNFDSSDTKLKISLTDDGLGFDPKKGKKGIGHRNIRSRVDKLKGHWEISSAPNKGTTLYVEIPFADKDIGGHIPIAEDTELEQV